MRYYEIVISPSIYSTSGSNSFAPITISSQYLGRDNYSSLDIFLDIFQSLYNQPASLGSIKIFGIDYNTLKANLNYARIKISVGMTKGLPLVNTEVPPLPIIDGMITQAYGNWQGTNVTLDLVVSPYPFSNSLPLDLQFNWPKGSSLESAVTNTLNNAFLNTGYTPQILGGYSPNLVYTEDVKLFFLSLYALSDKVNLLSKQINPDPNYIGASIASTPNGFLLTDGTVTTANTTITDIKYTDIIGNVTWIDFGVLQFKVVMRGDINIGDYVSLPTGVPIINTINSYAQVRNNIAYSGLFRVNQVHHVGQFRKADANSWVTVIDVLAPNELSSGFQPAIPL